MYLGKRCPVVTVPHTSKCLVPLTAMEISQQAHRVSHYRLHYGYHLHAVEVFTDWPASRAGEFYSDLRPPPFWQCR